MQTLPVPSLDASIVYSNASLARRPSDVCDRLAAAQNRVEQAYTAYSHARDDVTQLVPADTVPATADDLRRNYRYLFAGGKEIRAQLLHENAGGRCPMCGEGAASTLDHYLPKERFPEFSILPLNLIPACWRCNNLKGTHVVAASGRALFVHAYFDDLRSVAQFLFADVAVVDRVVSVTYRVVPPTDTTGVLRDRIVTHFEQLTLDRFYLNEAVNELGGLKGSVKYVLNQGGSAADVRALLWVLAVGIEDDKGRNDWKYALLTSMAACEDVCTGAFD